MKTVEEIYREMMDRFSQETGMEPNGTGEMAVRMYALAAQVYGLYEELAWTCRQCFAPDGHRGRTGKTWVSAGDCPKPCPAGQWDPPLLCPGGGGGGFGDCPRDGVYDGGLVAFETTQAGVLPAGELSVDLPAQAVEPGPGGNVSAGTVRTMAVAPVGVAACTNPVPFTGGGRKKGTRNCGPGFWPLTSSYPTAPMEPTMPRRPWRWRG